MTRNNIVVVVFSKNRALQLHLCLKTFYKYCDNADNYSVRVIYKADDHHVQSYETLKKEFFDVVFVKETDFKKNLINAVSGYDKTLFCVDDNVFTAPFNLNQCSDIMDYYPKIIGVSLRLGVNTKYCYSMAQYQAIPDFTSRYVGKYQDFLGYEWSGRQGDFGYPLELSSSLYRIKDIKNILWNTEYSNPNGCEWNMFCNLVNFWNNYPVLICYETSVAFCNPCNKVQTVNNNRAGRNSDYNVGELLMKFEDGYRIDDRDFEGMVSSGAHMEVGIRFIKEGGDGE